MTSRTQCFPDTTGKAHVWTPSNRNNTHKTLQMQTKQNHNVEDRSSGERERDSSLILGQSPTSRAGPTSKSSWATQIRCNRFKEKKERPQKWRSKGVKADLEWVGGEDVALSKYTVRKSQRITVVLLKRINFGYRQMLFPHWLRWLYGFSFLICCYVLYLAIFQC